MSKEDIITKGFKDILPTRSQVKKEKKWLEPERNPTEIEKKKMFAAGVGLGIRFVMGNHIHAFDDKLVKQLDGGPMETN